MVMSTEESAEFRATSTARTRTVCAPSERNTVAPLDPQPRQPSAQQVLNNEGRIARHSGGSRMPVAAEALRKLLQEFNARTSAKMSAIVTRSGVPVAWVLPDDAQVDNFATMAATLLGALEVMYATMKRNAPNRVTVVADGGILTVHGVTGK